MSRHTHPEKKWAAGTSESNARANHSSQSRLLPVGLTDATLGVYASHRGEPRVKGGTGAMCLLHGVWIFRES
jgi:hypothetical protein